MSTAWPPPPDLASIRELVRVADVEGHIAEGAPADEYEPEEDSIFAAIAHLPTREITVGTLDPILERVWQESFALDADSIARRRPALHELAAEIARFFGPEAQPQVRGAAS